eukprot:6233151-Prymnesium_polylepis.1
MSEVTRVALLKEAEQPFAERAFAIQTLRVAQLLCEGHNIAMQDFLCEQPSQNTAIDIWAATVDLLLNLDFELDATNFDILEGCLVSLVEGMQGNVSGKVSFALLETKLLDALDRLVDPDREIGGIQDG